MAFVRLIAIEDCRVGQGTFVEFDGEELAVFLLQDPDRVFVTDNACPHASGNLSGGPVEGNQADEIVTCPWHHWEFNLHTGVCTHSDRARVQRFDAEIREGAVWFDRQSS